MASPGDYLRKVQPGETLESIPRDAYNAFVDAALAARQGARVGGRAPAFSRDTNLVTVRNQSGRDVDRFGVLELADPIVGPGVNLDEFQRVVNFDGVTPTAGNVPFCILLEPLSDGAIGTGVVSGIIPCLINGRGGCALPRAGDTTALLAGDSGCRVEWADVESGSGPRWAYVNLPGCCASSGSEPWTKCRKRMIHWYCQDGVPYYIAEFDYYSADGRVLFTSDEPCPGTEPPVDNPNCCEAIGGSVLPTLTCAVSAKAGCFVDLPDTVIWESAADPSAPGKFMWVVSPSTPFTACGSDSSNADAWWVRPCYEPVAGVPNIQLGPIGANGGTYTCVPFTWTISLSLSGDSCSLHFSEA